MNVYSGLPYRVKSDDRGFTWAKFSSKDKISKCGPAWVKAVCRLRGCSRQADQFPVLHFLLLPQAIDVTAVYSKPHRFKIRPLLWGGILASILWSGLALAPALVAATEIRIDAQTVSSGQTIKVPIVIDRVEDLAGVKIVLQYDPGQLRYLATARAAAASQMMHVVNDKRPGTLIIVMAGATGIRGENLALFTVTFNVAAELPAKTQITLRIAESQLMSAQLKDITHAVAIKPLSVDGPSPDLSSIKIQ